MINRHTSPVARLAVLLITLSAVAALPGASAPVILTTPASVSTVASGTAAFLVNASGEAPLDYQWLHNGQPIAGATRFSLTLPGVTARDAGSYTVRVSNASGSVTSAAAQLGVGPAPAAPIVEARFRADARLEVESERTSFILPLPDGRVMIASATNDRSRLLRLLADGQIDPAFASVAVDSTVPQLTLQPDGRVLVAGGRDYGKPSPAEFFRVNVDGSRDSTFAPPTDLFVGFGPSNAGRKAIASLVLQPDGKILLLADVGRVLRLHSTGEMDASFTSSVVGNGQSAGGSIALSDTGAIYRAMPSSGLTRLLANGQLDTTFVSPLPSSTSSPSTGSNAFQVVRGFGDRMLVTYRTWTGLGGTSIGIAAGSLQLLTDGRAFSRGSAGWIVAAPGSDGSFVTNEGPEAPYLALWSPDGVSKPPMNWGVAGRSPWTYAAAIGPEGGIWVGGDFSFYNGVVSPRVVRLNRVPSEVAGSPAVLGTWADADSVAFGEPITVSVAANSAAPVTYEWDVSGGTSWNEFSASQTLGPTLTFVPPPSLNPTMANRKQWMVRARNSTGASPVASGTYTVRPAVLASASQPASVSAAVGRDASLIVTLKPGVVVTEAEWRRGGVVLPPDNSWLGSFDAGRTRLSVYRLYNVSPADAGTYTVTLTSSDGQRATFAPILVTVGDISRLTNFSVRAQVGGGERALVVGFVIPPNFFPRGLLVRGIGPSLALFGVTDVLPDPTLSLHGAGGLISSASRWGQAQGTSNSIFHHFGAFQLPEGSADTAILGTGPIFGSQSFYPGSYTVLLKGSQNTSGHALLEVYEADTRSERLSNFSALSYVSGTPGTIVGFVIRGGVSKRVLVRAAGPALAALGVKGALGRLRLTVLDQAGRVVATNEAWHDQSDPGSVTNAARNVGAFTFGAGSRDAALVLSLPPANYTATVTGMDGDSGAVLIEIYEVP